ncbi:SpoIIE family protein phosphatase [Dechloromonas sp. A34]|uniref:SpoIIE family protein phosphatase n=1 Tax=Dechloromonas sp. A34 TaxID=447588 RepID=UPI002249142D|nr:SpoIIE family protein phosphatase [Dechloromonas sp. A34]
MNRPGPPYEYAVAGRAIGGERQSGDAALVQATTDGVLIAVVDGLGHGDEAAMAAQTAVAVLREHAGEPLASLLQRCHLHLQPTRGAAMAVAMVDTAKATLTWAGVGNVEAVLVASPRSPVRGKQCLTNRCGVVGYRLPAVEGREVPIYPGDLLILATDGIDECFVSAEMPRGPPDHLARSILDCHGKATDDALVLVLRWLGAEASLRRAS